MVFDAMPPLAASTTTLDKVQSVPMSVWLQIGAAILGLILIVLVLRKLANVNKIVLGAVVFIVVSFVGFSWIYERNEPSWATPFIEPLAKFFPTKASMR